MSNSPGRATLGGLAERGSSPEGQRRTRRVKEIRNGQRATRCRAALYIRTSTDRQHVTNQRPEVEQLVRARDLEVVSVYEEQLSAAAKTRPAFDAMMKAAHVGAFDVLVVWSLDRLGRSMLGNLQTVLDLERKGVVVLSVKESFLDAELGPARQLLLGVLGWVAEQERLRIGERVRAGLDRAKRQGIRLGRPRAHVNVGLALQLHHEGRSVRQIAKTLGVSSSALHRAMALSRNPHLREDVQVVGAA